MILFFDHENDDDLDVSTVLDDLEDDAFVGAAKKASTAESATARAGAEKKPRKQTRHTKQQATFEAALSQFSTIAKSTASSEAESSKMLMEMEVKRDTHQREWEEKRDAENRKYQEEKERDRREYEENQERLRNEYEEKRERERIEYTEKKEEERKTREDQRWRMDKEFLAGVLNSLKK